MACGPVKADEGAMQEERAACCRNNTISTKHDEKKHKCSISASGKDVVFVVGCGTGRRKSSD